MNRLGISLEENENDIPDIHLDESGNLAFATNAEAIGQHVKQRLKTFQGEWFLDTVAGVPWLSEILGKRYDPILAESVTKSEILGTEGVTEITSFSVAFDLNLRKLDKHSISISTVYDNEVSL